MAEMKLKNIPYLHTSKIIDFCTNIALFALTNIFVYLVSCILLKTLSPML